MNDRTVALAAVRDVLRTADLLREERGPGDVSVGGVAQDSRRVRAGDLFLAWKGTAVDAHDFVADAVTRGAAAAVVERPVEAAIPQLVVDDGRRAAALAAQRVMGAPSEELSAVGVTGTNGKTTTALLIRHLLASRMQAAVIGTLGVVDDDGVRPGTEGLTTPGPVQLAVWLRELVDGGTEVVVVEASSHALEQARLDGIRFDVAVFTNLSQDHLDYHVDMEAYRAAKARLVELVDPEGAVVVNADEPAWASLDTGGRRALRFSIGGEADIRARDLRLDAHGSSFTLHAGDGARPVRLPLVGRYNVENALAAAGAALATGMSLDQVVEGLADAPPVPGRLEAVLSEPYTVLIDFAHTPAALEGALSAVRPLTEGRLIVVFGAGGDRDRTKRGPMARAAARLADVVVLTSDNPRTEDPEAIIDDLAAAIEGETFLRHADRREAIRMALREARPGDTVLLAGKGHETYQVLGTVKEPFDERSIVRDALAAGGAP